MQADHKAHHDIMLLTEIYTQKKSKKKQIEVTMSFYNFVCNLKTIARDASNSYPQNVIRHSKFYKERESMDN